MRDATRHLLQRLDECQLWFRRIGKDDLPWPAGRRLRSWEDALASCDCEGYQDLQQEAHNRIGLQLEQHLLNRWNYHIEQVQPAVRALAEEKTRFWQDLIKDVDRLQAQVRWDVLNACMELEYEGHVTTRFYVDLMDWYIAGHFPCGWDGSLDDGTIVLF